MKRLPLCLVLGLAAFLAGCEGPCSKIAPLTGPASSNGAVDFSTYVAAGTSISAGWQSSGLVDRHQIHSFPAVFAQQIGKTVQLDGRGTFSIPVWDRDGFPALLEIKSYSPLVINNIGRVTGNPVNDQPAAFHNMAVPYAVAFDFVDTTFYYNNPTAQVPRPAEATSLFNGIARHRGTIASQVLSLSPTFISWEYGANEVLGPASTGAAPSATTGANHAALLTASMNLIHTFAPNAKVAVVNVPDVTSIPFFTTFPPFTVSLTTGLPVALIGPGGASLAAGDLVTLGAGTLLAQGIGFPVGSYNYVNPSAPGNGTALPGAVVLDAAEVAATSLEVAKMNTAVDTVALRPFVVKVDLHALLAAAAQNGIRIGGTTFTTDFVTGGLFSLDGVHPNDLADAVIANVMIDAVNTKFGSSIAHANPLAFAGANASRAVPARGPAGLPRPMILEGVKTGLIGSPLAH